MRSILVASVVLAVVALGVGVARAQTGQIVVTTVPPGADIYVDGQRVGPSPVVAGALLPGAHLIVARAEDGTRVQQVATVRAGESIAVELAVGAPTAPTQSDTPVSPEVPSAPPASTPAAAAPTHDGDGPAAPPAPTGPEAPTEPIAAQLGLTAPPSGGWSGASQANAGFVVQLVLAGVFAVGGAVTMAVGLGVRDTALQIGLGVGGGLGGLTMGLIFLILAMRAGPTSPGNAADSGCVYGSLSPYVDVGANGALVGVRGHM
jgi:hypothetical protein